MQLWKKKTTKTSASSSNNELDVILSSSGVRAPAFIGALKSVQEKGYEVKRIAGTSGGAIVAASYALGMSVEEMEDHAKKVNYKELKDFSLKNLCSIRNPSLYSGKPLDELYKSLFGNAKLRDFQIDCKITVVTIGGGRRRIVLDRTSYPNLPVWEAVRMSSSIPFIFPYKKLDGRPVTDGGLVAEDQTSIFPDTERPVICLRPKASSLRAHAEDAEISVYIWTLIRSVTEYLTDAVENQEVVIGKHDRHIVLPTGSLTTFNFDITEEDVVRLIEYGYNAVSQYNLLSHTDPR